METGLPADLSAVEAARPTVLLHGFTGSSESWGDSLLSGLRSAGCLPVAVDLPGHGRNASSTQGDEVDLRDALVIVDDATKEFVSYDLVGYSMGGRIALHVALARPGRVRRLVLESASPGLADASERAARRVRDGELTDRIRSVGVPAFVEEWAALPMFASQERCPAEARARLNDLRLRNTARGLAAALRGLGTGVLPSLWDRLDELACPTLLLAGADDPKFVDIASRMAPRVKRGRMLVIEGAGHAVHFEAPDPWLDAVTGFLEG